ncbi:MAG: hypothetical protein QOK15_1866 [Nocardioidaceae bacterium]|jgi:uncharacterized protein (TIGR03086 family)|nr:hypothetical protein [Nocardioidaceae bacterium]
MRLDELHRRAVEAWQARVDAVRQDQWSAATPCAEWDVRALVNHVVGEELWTSPLVEGSTIEEVGDRFDGDVLGGAPTEAARSAAQAAATTVDERLSEGGIAHLSYADVPIEEYVHQLTADHLIHGWDLAAATGQSRQLDPDLVTEVAAWFADRESMYREGGAIGPRVETGGDAQDDLLARFGRDPSW